MRRIVIPLFVLTIAAAAPIPAQIPDEFTNLQVLPEDISKRELVATMRGFAGALGVRCNHCHVGPENLQGMDFATDERQAKQTARQMIRMVAAINQEYLSGIKTSAARPVRVECKTCHRGIVIPEPIEDLLAATVESEGFENGLAKYRELREEHYGRSAYDFGPQPLNSLAEDLFRQGMQEEAIRLTQMNNDLHPDYPWSRTLLGRFHRNRGEKEEALAAFEAALALAPEDEWVQQQIEALRQPDGEAEADGG